MSEGAAAESRERAVSLFRFLKEVTELRLVPVRDLGRYEEVLWFHEVPHEKECSCAAWHQGGDLESDDAWLEVRKPKLDLPPPPPRELAPWLSLDELKDSSREAPEMLREISVRVEDAEDVEPENRFEKRYLADHPELQPIWQRYVENGWRAWAELDRPSRAVQAIYNRLFSIYQRQKRLGEAFEVVLGLGLLEWKVSSGGQPLRRHLLTAQTALTFDTKRGVISVGPAAGGAELRLEQEMLDPVQRPSPDIQRALESELQEIHDEIWDGTLAPELLRRWTNAVASDGEFRTNLVPMQSGHSGPRVTLAPAIILRKRTERSFVRFFEEALDQLESGDDVPPGLERFTHIVDDPHARESDDADEESTGAASPEIYFPLASNKAQVEIVQRLENNQGVLVQGPPGTGKSHTIVNLICHSLANGQRVLVTSHTARALGVVRGFLSERVTDLSPLAVVLLGNDRDSLQAMEDSVHGITGRHVSWNERVATKKISDLERELDELRRSQAKLQTHLRAIRESETYQHPPLAGGYKGTLAKIARELRTQAERFDWLTDEVPKDAAPPMKVTDFGNLVRLMGDKDVEEAADSPWEAADVSETLPSEQFEQLVEKQARARKAHEGNRNLREREEYGVLAALPNEARSEFREHLEELLARADRVSRHIEDWTERAVTEILGDRDRPWQQLLVQTREHLLSLGTRVHQADGMRLTGAEGKDHDEIRQDAKAMLEHSAAGGGWGFGPFRAHPAKRALYIKKELKLDGKACDTEETLWELVSWLDVENHLSSAKDLWDPIRKTVARGFAAQQAEIEDLCEPLEDALGLLELKRGLEGWIRNKGSDLTEPSWHHLEELRDLVSCCDAADAEAHFEESVQELEQVVNHLDNRWMGRALHPSAGRVIQAARGCDPKEYSDALDELGRDSHLQGKAAERDRLLEALLTAAPNTAHALQNDPQSPTWIGRVELFEKAWSWAAANHWLREMSDPASEKNTRYELEHLQGRVLTTLQQIASLNAWKHCFARMSEHERQHLVAWSKAVKNIGKGTGKYAARHRRTAREHMNECRSAIPAWIMPLYRVAETVRPGRDVFDLAIVDEASQSGPEALLLTYLAKKIVVVGDDKQISPENVGVDRGDVQRLQEQHLARLPLHDDYNLENSFFDLAEIRYQGRIRLREHFRCMPEIIQFSNNLCYQSEPLIPLKQFGAGRLKPVVQAIHVPEGHVSSSGSTKINLPEATSIADKIELCCKEPAYDGKTFGVVSLLGNHQARKIEELLVQRIGPELIEQRKIVCGDAYAFQGDERDVMFLSMVSSPANGRRVRALTDERAKRRFNVASSRAREQLYLYHTVTVNDLGPACLRKQLLEYCLNPSVDQSEVSDLPVGDWRRLAWEADRVAVRPPDPFDSWFEIDVFLRVFDRGFRVIPQYEFADYRVDLMVEGVHGRLAVECDGDFWHGPDRFDADMARQREMERCGLRFWRIRESAFTLSPERSLEDLWKTLEDCQITSTAELSVPRKGDVDDTLAGEEVAWNPGSLVLPEVPVPGSDSTLSEVDAQGAEVSRERGDGGLDSGPLRPEPPALDVEPNRTVQIGDMVEYYFADQPDQRLKRRIVEAGRGSEDQNNLHFGSPIGRALLNAQVGDTALLFLADGRKREVHIVGLARQSDDKGADQSGTGEIAGSPGGRSGVCLSRDYERWPSHPTPDPRLARAGEVKAHLIEIIRIEGPMLAHRAYQLYTKASGSQKVGKTIRQSLDAALQAAITEGSVVVEGEHSRDDLRLGIVRIARSPAVVVRSRGDRRFDEIPASEVRELVARCISTSAEPLSKAEVSQHVAAHYEIGRMSSKVREILDRIYEDLTSNRSSVDI